MGETEEKIHQGETEEKIHRVKYLRDCCKVFGLIYFSCSKVKNENVLSSSNFNVFSNPVMGAIGLCSVLKED